MIQEFIEKVHLILNSCSKIQPRYDNYNAVFLPAQNVCGTTSDGSLPDSRKPQQNIAQHGCLAVWKVLPHCDECCEKDYAHPPANIRNKFSKSRNQPFVCVMEQAGYDKLQSAKQERNFGFFCTKIADMF